MTLITSVTDNYKYTPESLVTLRQELQHHLDICAKAEHCNSFEETMGMIAAELNIVLDGVYDVEELSAVLVEALRKRKIDNALHLTLNRFRL